MEQTLTNQRMRGKILPPPFLPYPQQIPIIEKMIHSIKDGLNGLIIQPTATGKSVEAAFTARHLIWENHMKGLYLYDENEGLEQARLKFEHVFGQNNITCANFFGYGKDDSVTEADMVFASFQSLNNHHEKWYQMFDTKHFGFIIVNEGHYSEAPTYKEVIHYFECPRIGMTATPRRMDGLDILMTFDRVLHEMLFEEALVKGWIASLDYRSLNHGLSTQKLKKICREVLEEGKRISIKQLNESIFIDALDEKVFEEIYKVAFPKDEKPLQTIIFCENILHAGEVYERMNKDGVSVGIVHSGNGRNHNRETITEFRKNTIQFIISVDLLNEDIDFPLAELGVFLRSTNSERIWIQQMGRLLRFVKGKKENGIILDFVGNWERIIMIQELLGRVELYAEKFLEENPDLPPLQRDVLKVSGTGFTFSFSEEIVDVISIIKTLRDGFYGTWQEASEAVIVLGIESRREYGKRFKKDPRLHSNPHRAYQDFPGYTVFLGKGKKEKPYPTWQEASEATIALGIESFLEYVKRYKEDPKLYSHPESYINFPGYTVFLGKGKKEKPYLTWQEASEATIALGIEFRREYKKRYKEDPRLPSNPDVFYQDFPDYTVFLGKGKKEKPYPTWQEASEATIALGIESRREYEKRCKEDPRLRSDPDRTYQDFPGYTVFLGKGKKEKPYLTWQEASEATIALGIGSRREYKKRYKEDPRLRSNPDVFYQDFPDYTVFLGKAKKHSAK